jgi:hypothetical protein
MWPKKWIDRASKTGPSKCGLKYRKFRIGRYHSISPIQHDPIPEDQPDAAKAEECIKSIAEIEKQERDVE